MKERKTWKELTSNSDSTYNTKFLEVRHVKKQNKTTTTTTKTRSSHFGVWQLENRLLKPPFWEWPSYIAFRWLDILAQFSRKPCVNQRKIKTTEWCSLTKRKATCKTENRPKIRRNSPPIKDHKDHDGNANENITWKLINLGYLNYFVIIRTRSTCTMWLNDPGTELPGTTFKLRKEMKNSASCIHKTLNLIHNVVLQRITKKRTKTFNVRAERLFLLMRPTDLWRSLDC